MGTIRVRVITFLMLLFATTANAEVLVQYSMTGGSAETTTNATGIAGGTLTNGSMTSFSTSDSAGYSSDPEIRVLPASGATASSTAVSTNSYFSFSVTPTNLEMDLTSLTFNTARGGSSTPRGYVVRSSIDNYASNIATANINTVRPTWTAVSIDLSGASFQNLTSAITFRIYSYTPGTSLSIEYDDITVNGTTTATGGGGGTTTSDTYDDIPPTLTRYIEMSRSGTTVTAKIYSDANYTTLLDTLTVTDTGTAYRYLYAPIANNTGVSGSTFSGSIQDLDLTVESGANCDSNCSLCGNQTTCEASLNTCYWWNNSTCNPVAQPVSLERSIKLNGQNITGGNWP